MGQSHPTKKEVVTEFRRGEILQAARKVFSRQGYRSTTVDEIAEEAGIAKGTLYLYFKAKEEIYLTALTQDCRRLSEETARRVAQAPNLLAKLSEYASVRLEHSERNTEFVRIFFSEFSNLASPARVNQEFQTFIQENINLLRCAIREGISNQEIRDVEVDRAAFAINDLTRSAIERRISSAEKGPVEDDLKFLLDLVWRGLVRQ